MQLLDNFIILALIAAAFFGGKKMSDSYHRTIISELQYQLRLSAAEKGMGYVAPPVKRVQLGQPFMDRLKENKRAVQQLNKNV